MPHSLRFSALFVGLNCLAGLCRAEDIHIGGASIDMQFTTAPAPALREVTDTWIKTSAKAVTTYYGAFPVHHVRLRITPGAGHTPEGGETFGWEGALIKISLGRDATAADLSDDWVLVHEMVHLALPNVPERQHWLEEGLATYVEPIARARAGQLTPAHVWNEMVENFPQGQPEKGDRGLDHTPTWGRTYYGGAMFCLRADIEIRRRTGNRRGLEHALRGILAAGGSIETSWSIDRIIAAGDAATGVPVLRELYDEMKDKPVRVDLSAVWKQLGVRPQGHTVTFDDTAPLATVRKAITGG
ncbi:MAG: hypothetical protein ABJF10_18795 [Chthoniobacter sp.]|uniref:hypothetical protein n=1 Tax=Chthoniobacter sp. TaxID=2510640 RepID=UPI0032A268BD